MNKCEHNMTTMNLEGAMLSTRVSICLECCKTDGEIELDEKLTQLHVDYLLSQGKVKKLKSFIEKASFDESQGQYYFDMPNSTNVIWTDSLIDLYNKVKEEDGKLKVRDESYWLPEKDGRDS